MPQVIIEQPGVSPVTIPLSTAEVHLGRAETNTVVLVADEVSRNHAKMVRRGDKTVLYDLNSLNGTYVNRQRIVERVLSHMDEVFLGSKCRIVFRDDPSTDGTMPAGPPDENRESSILVRNLDKIREEMDRVGQSLTLIGRKGRTPEISGGPVQAPVPPPAELATMGQAYRRLSALYHASKLISSNFDLSKRLSDVLDTAIEAMDAERGFVMLHDEQTGKLEVKVAREMGQELHASAPSMSIAERASVDGEPVLMSDADNDSRFSGRESIIRQRISSAMCVPLRAENRILGSIYVDTRKLGVTFTQEDLELFASLASQSALAIDNVRLYEQMLEAEKKRLSLGRFLSPAIVDEIMKKDAVLELGGRKSTVTSMFCDIRGFTPLAEKMPAATLVDMLNEHFTAMTEIIFQLHGTLDKYIGDEIMAVFGAPISSHDDAERAVKAALLMQAKNAELNAARTLAGRPTFEMGVGIETGEVIAGYIGSPKRMDFTVIGDRVNTARRLCSLAEERQVVIGETAFQRVKDITDSRILGAVMLKGKENAENAYEILRLKG